MRLSDLLPQYDGYHRVAIAQEYGIMNEGLYTMGRMKDLIEEKTKHLKEDSFGVNDDLGGQMDIEASPVRRGAVKKMFAQGHGLRLLVGADNMKDLLVVWVGDGDSNVGAIHDTVASQFGLSIYDERHVPLEMTRDGKLRVTTTAQGQFDDPREVEDVLDRNREYQQIFGGQKVDMSRLEDI